MSAKHLGWAWRVPLANVRGSAASTQQLVLIALVELANAWGKVPDRVSVATIAAMTRLSRGAVSAALGALEVQGVIVALDGRSGGRRPTRWRLAVSPTAHQEDGSTAHQEDGSDGANRAPAGANRAPDDANRAPGARVSLSSLSPPFSSRVREAEALARSPKAAHASEDQPDPEPEPDEEAERVEAEAREEAEMERLRAEWAEADRRRAATNGRMKPADEPRPVVVRCPHPDCGLGGGFHVVDCPAAAQ